MPWPTKRNHSRRPQFFPGTENHVHNRLISFVLSSEIVTITAGKIVMKTDQRRVVIIRKSSPNLRLIALEDTPPPRSGRGTARGARTRF